MAVNKLALKTSPEVMKQFKILRDHYFSSPYHKLRRSYSYGMRLFRLALAIAVNFYLNDFFKNFKTHFKNRLSRRPNFSYVASIGVGLQSLYNWKCKNLKWPSKVTSTRVFLYCLQRLLYTIFTVTQRMRIC